MLAPYASDVALAERSPALERVADERYAARVDPAAAASRPAVPADLTELPIWVMFPPMPEPPPRWFRFAVKVFALLTFCGGPLHFAGLLRAYVGQPYDFIIAFAPVAVLVLVTLSVVEDRPARPSPFLVGSGAVALGVILLESAHAAFQILTGESQQDAGLILFGCAVSVATAFIYRRLTRAP